MPPENARLLVCNFTLLCSFLAFLIYLDKSPFYQWGEETFGDEEYYDKLNHSNLEQGKIDLLINLHKEITRNMVDTGLGMLVVNAAGFSTLLLHTTGLLDKIFPSRDRLTLMSHRLYSIFRPSSNIKTCHDDCPDEFICPISYEVMKKPVYSIKYPKLYRCDESSLLEWLRYSNKHPLLNDVPYVKADWVEDIELKTQISNYLDNQGNANTI